MTFVYIALAIGAGSVVCGLWSLIFDEFEIEVEK